MHSTKLSTLCDKILEAGWLLAVIVTPLFFNVYSSRVFEPDKLTTLRSLALVMGAVWLIKFIGERTSGRTGYEVTWRTPLVLPTLFTVVVYLISTVLSVNPWVSLVGSYQRLQGTYTTFSYIVVFLVLLQGLRTRAQLDRLVTVIILNSLPISLYGIIQRRGLDPLPWGGDVTRRVASNMGNAIFVAAYLIMVWPLTVARIVQSFRAILRDEQSSWADVFRAAGYMVIATVTLVTIYFAQSRGPLLGIIAGSYFLFLLLAMTLRNKAGAILTFVVILMVGTVVGGLLVINIPGGPLQHLQERRLFGRLGNVLQFESGTGKVRSLIWEGMTDMILAEKQIQEPPTADHPEGKVDTLHPIRPLVGYGPETVYVAYNGFYPPLLGHFESRTASPDRAHNETLDALAITGVLGLAAYLWVFGAALYFALKWLGLIPSRGWLYLLIGLVVVLSAATIGFFWWWQGLHFFGAALTFGIAAGMGLYVAILGVRTGVRLLRSGDAGLPKPHPDAILLIAILATIVAHLVEINFGIAIASTRTTFWACAGMLVVLGLGKIGDYQASATADSGNGAQNGRRRSSRQGRRRRQRSQAPARGQTLRWLSPILALALISGFVLSTLSFDFITNAERLTQSGRIISRALTVLTNRSAQTCPSRWNSILGECRSPAPLLMFGFTWLMSGVIFISEVAKGGVFRRGKGEELLAIVVFYTVSFLVAILFASLLTSHQAAMIRQQPQSMPDVLRLADRVAALLNYYYGLIAFLLLAIGVVLYLALPQKPQTVAQPWGLLGLIPLLIAIILALNTNLQPIHADMIYKQAEPYERQNQWPVAINIYEHAIEHAPREDFYYLYLGRALLEYASRLEDPNAREQVMQRTETVLIEAREINPLNTDHSANLARMYRRWADLSNEPERRQELLERSAENYDHATSLSPHNPILWNEWAMLQYYGLKDEEAYERTLEQSLAIDDEFDQTWLMCGDVNRQAGDLEAAVDCYEKALEINPRTSKVWTALGETYRAMERWDDAIHAYTSSLQVNAQDANAWRALADAYITLQRWDDAIDALEAAAAQNPNANDVWNLYQVLAQLYTQVGRPQQALAYAQQALELAPDDQKATVETLVEQLQALTQAGAVTETQPVVIESAP